MYNRGLVFGAAPIVSPLGSAAPPSILKDRSRFKNDGTFTNVTWSQLPSGLWTMGFNGAGLITLPTRTVLGGQAAFSVACWFKTSISGVEQYLISTWTGGSLYFAISATNKVRLIIFTSSGQSPAPVPATSVNDNKWRLAVGTYDGSNINIYLNGVSDVAPIAHTGRMNSDATTPVVLGRRSNLASGFLTGSMALPRLFLYALSADQISRIYEAERRWFV